MQGKGAILALAIAVSLFGAGAGMLVFAAMTAFGG